MKTHNRSTRRQTKPVRKRSSWRVRAMNGLLMSVLFLGGGAFGIGAYQYVDDKMQVSAAQNQADMLLDARPDESADTAESIWSRKMDFEGTGLVKGDVIGKLLIPKLDGELPIVEGVDADDLAKGVGHDHDTLLPLDDGQIVLSGHRDTVFRGVGALEIGDTFILQLPYGDFEYRLTSTKIVDAEDRSIIVPHDKETLTVTTCYPFNYVGHAPNRYIMNAEPVFDMNSGLSS